MTTSTNITDKYQNFLFYIICLLPLGLIFSRAFADFLVIIISILVIFNFKKLNKFFLSKYIKIDFLILLIFFLYLLCNLFFSSKISLSIERTFPFIRWLFFVIGVSYFFALADRYKINLFVKFFIAILVLQCVYSIIEFTIIQYNQYFIEFDSSLTNQSFEYRANGFFKDAKSGSYLSKFFLIPFLWIYSKQSLNYKTISFIIIIFLGIFISGERAAIIILFFTLFLVFIFLKNERLKFLKIFLIAFISLAILLLSVPHYKTRIVDSTFYLLGLNKFIDDTKLEEAYHNSGGDILEEINTFYDSQHGAHFLTAIEIWKKNKFFGSGLKTFRYMSPNEEYENINSKNKHLRVATHPHNYYLEILSELGLFGLIIFVLLGFRVLYSLILLRNLDQKDYFYIAPTILCLVFFWPLMTTGSFFTNWVGIIFWFLFAMSVGFKYRYFLNNNDIKN